jgi:hypothetical protein
MRAALAVLALVVAAPAQAATKVTWPAQRTYAPGERIAVTVKGERRVRVAVLRVSATGKVMAAVTRRTLARGTVRATLARAGRYEVRVGARKRALQAVAPAGGEPCATPASTVSVEVTLGADRVQRGQTLSYSITNTSDGCITTGAAYALEHQQADGSWVPAPWPLVFAQYAVTLPEGGVFAKAVSIPADAPLGIYRLIETGGFTEPTFEVVA